MSAKRDHGALLSAADAAIRRIERLEFGLLVCVSEREQCNSQCGDRRWDNHECACAAKARSYLPQSERK